MGGRRETAQSWRRHTRWAAGILLALIAVGLVVLTLTDRTGSTRHNEPTSASCEGLAALCGRHLNEVVFAGTHNSYAASAQPGWHFASQRYGISRQLEAGVRALLLDVHFGVYDQDTGRVRTDLSAEGSDRNKVAKQVPARALRLADRLAGRVGVGRLTGTPELYLCHTLCELGADPLNRELKAIASFLAEHPDEVLIVIVEDYIPPAAIERAFAQAQTSRAAPDSGRADRPRSPTGGLRGEGGRNAGVVHAGVLLHPGHATRRGAAGSAEL
jgi:hypothetical protein